ncbi:MAG: hypothetical protein QOE92_1434 [Chloroflexota bacterium]|nr:hypothetical protein [Chloroflexota bacterium]
MSFMLGDRGRRWSESPAAVAGVVAGGALLASVAVGWVVAVQPINGVFFIAIAGAIVLAGLTYRRPGVGLAVLILALPFYPYILARLQVWGVSPLVVAQMRYWKELVLVVLVLRAVRNRYPFDSRIDRVAIGVMVVTTVFAVFPIGPADTYSRVLAARQIAAAILLFMAVRHLDLSPRAVSFIQTGLVVAGVVLSLFAFWNHFAPEDWTSFVRNSGLAAYQHSAVESSVTVVVDRGTLAGQEYIRSGSLFLNPLSLGHFMLIPIAVVLARGVASRPRAFDILAGAICVAGLMTTLTRSAIVAVPLMVAIAVSGGLHRQRLALGLFAVSLALYPVAGSLGVGEQLQSGLDPTNTRTEGHVDALQSDVQAMISRPQGTGLATAGPQGERFGVEGHTIAESWFFQVGLETGLLGMVLYVSLLVMAMRELWARSKLGSSAATAAVCALSGLAFAGLVLHSFGDLHTAFAAWGLAGMALPVAMTARAAKPAQAPATARSAA